MEFSQLLEIVGDEPVFESGLLLAGEVDPSDVRRQLSRWMQTGRITQLRRELYALAPPYQKVKPHPFLVANRLVRGSYVSLQSALAHLVHAAPTPVQGRNIAREYLQARILDALQRAGAMVALAFHGGTALRMHRPALITAE